MKTNPDDSAMGHYATLGLTKREYFAGLAMQGMLANGEIMMVFARSEEDSKKIYDGIVKSADTLIEALNKN